MWAALSPADSMLFFHFFALGGYGKKVVGSGEKHKRKKLQPSHRGGGRRDGSI